MSRNQDPAALMQDELQMMLELSTRHVEALEALVEEVKTIATASVPSTTVYNQTVQQLPSHPAEEAVQGDEEMIGLADGRNVPKACVDALDEYEITWPGATFPTARAGIVWAVLAAYSGDFAKRSAADGLCLNDDPMIREKSSPCILDADHEEDHVDNSGGTWLRR